MGGGGGGGDKSSTHQVTEVKLPPWVEAASQANYARAQAVADRPFEQYTGPRVADLSSDFWGGRSNLKNLSKYIPYYSKAMASLSPLLQYQAGNITARDVKGGRVPDEALDEYLNPYIENVENRAIGAARREGELAQQGLLSEATQKGAFGGSRQAIQAAVQGAETARGIGDISAQLRKEGYDTATGLITSDLNRRLEADRAAAELNLRAQESTEASRQFGAGLKRDVADQIVRIADAGQKAYMNKIASFYGTGQMRQAQQQREYDDKRAMWQEKRDYPLEQLNIVMSALGMSPYGRTETTNKQTTSEVGGGGAGMVGGLFQALPSILGLFSDERAKTNIEKVGTLGDLPIYAYDYKADVQRAKRSKKAMGPKRVGPMAQDVERLAPQLVRTVGKRKVIDLKALTA